MPNTMSSWLRAPSFPDTSIGDSSLMNSGTIALYRPTQRPWMILPMISVANTGISVKTVPMIDIEAVTMKEFLS